MDTDRLVEVAPHYAVMLLVVFLVLALLQAVVGEVSFWIELAVVIVIASAYRPLVTRLGIGPSAWT